MVPTAWTATILALAAYRITRLLGWDDLPQIIRARAWATGQSTMISGSSNTVLGVTNEEPQIVTTWRRPTLAHFLACPFCQGFWVSVVVWAAWYWQPQWTVVALSPWALSAAVGLIAKRLDP